MSHKYIILGESCEEWAVWDKQSIHDWTHISREEHTALLKEKDAKIEDQRKFIKLLDFLKSEN